MRNINVLEDVAACLLLLIWAPFLACHKVIILCDKTQIVSIFNGGAPRNPDALVWLKTVLQVGLCFSF